MRNYTLSSDALTIAGNGVVGTDTIALANVGAAQLTGGPSNDTFTLDGWGGTTTINGGTGTNTLVLAAGTVNTSRLTVSNVQTLEIAPTTGTIFPVAGDGSFGHTPGTTAQPEWRFTLNDPTGVAVDSQGDLFIADSANNVIREVTPAGIITTVAGTGAAGYTGDGGPATAATLNDPTGVAVDAQGDLFIADSGNNVIREVTAGTISTVAGTGAAGYTGDGRFRPPPPRSMIPLAWRWMRRATCSSPTRATTGFVRCWPARVDHHRRRQRIEGRLHRRRRAGHGRDAQRSHGRGGGRGGRPVHRRLGE